MANWVIEELQIQRSKQTRLDHYQQYQAHIEEMDRLDAATESVGHMRGRRFNKIAQTHNIFTIFNQIINQKH